MNPGFSDNDRFEPGDVPDPGFGLGREIESHQYTTSPKIIEMSLEDVTTDDQVLELALNLLDAKELISIQNLSSQIYSEAKLTRITIQRHNNEEPSSFLIKHGTNFKDGSNSLFKSLSADGHAELARLLASFPSNNTNIREVQAYNFLSRSKVISTPSFSGAIVDTDRDESILIIADLGEASILKPDQYSHELISSLVDVLASFHADLIHMEVTEHESDWIGQWWAGDRSDYTDPAIMKYAVNHIEPTVSGDVRIACERVQEFCDLLPEVETYLAKLPRTWIHFDLNPNNILFNHESEEPHFIDWQTFCVGVPQFDLVQLLCPHYGQDRISELESCLVQYKVSMESTELSQLSYKELFDTFLLAAHYQFARTCIPQAFGIVPGVRGDWANREFNNLASIIANLPRTFVPDLINL